MLNNNCDRITGFVMRCITDKKGMVAVFPRTIHVIDNPFFAFSLRDRLDLNCSRLARHGDATDIEIMVTGGAQRPVHHLSHALADHGKRPWADIKRLGLHWIALRKVWG